MTLRAYAERIGVNEFTVHTWKKAADVAVVAGHNFAELTGCVKHLAAIHAAPKETWKTWCQLAPNHGSSRDGWTPSAFAIFTMLRRLGLTSPRSTRLMYDQCSPERSANRV